jgi:hypothetical protein
MPINKVWNIMEYQGRLNIIVKMMSESAILILETGKLDYDSEIGVNYFYVFVNKIKI